MSFKKQYVSYCNDQFKFPIRNTQDLVEIV